MHPDLSLKGDFERYLLWIDVGFPSQKRLDRAVQQSDQVIVITPKNSIWLKDNERFFKRKNIKVLPIEAEFLQQLSKDITQRLDWSVVVDQNKLTIANSHGFYETSFKEDVAINY